jgi:mono/diheme cytochrome c family protein
MTGKLGSVAVAIAIAIFFVACAGEDPELEAIVPLAADADGATVYEARCASCHGTDLRGTDKGPSQLSIVYEPGHHGDDSYRSAIRNGAQQHHWPFGDMPAVESVTDDQIEAVISYIRGQQGRLGFEQ